MELNNSFKKSPSSHFENAHQTGRYSEIIRTQGKAINLFKKNLQLAGISSQHIDQITQKILIDFSHQPESLSLLTPEDKSSLFYRAAIQVLGEKEFDLAMERLHIIRENKKKIDSQL